MAAMKKIIVPAVCLAILFLIEYLGFFAGINDYLYDLAFRIRGAQTPPARIAIVAVDEKTMAALGRWPLARKHYAALLEKVNAADVVGFDIVMAEPSPDDALLAAAMAKCREVVLPVVIEEDMSAVYPVRAFAPSRTGHVHIERSIDGVAREVWHTLYFRERVLPSFASVIYEAANAAAFARSGPQAISRPASIYQSDMMRINYYGGPGTFTRVSLLDVLNGRYGPDFFRGRIVLVGISAMGLVDSVMTPFSETRMGTAGVEVQANIVANLLAGDEMKSVPAAVRTITGAALALLLYALFFRTTEGQGALILLAYLGVVAAIVYAAFSLRHWWYGPAGTYVAAVVLFAAAYVLKLHDAAVSLGATYDAIRPQLRNKPSQAERSLAEKGIAGIFTPRGIQAQAALLDAITHELIFEKELADRILLSDVFGVAVFDGQGRLVMASGDVRQICEAQAISLEDRDRFAAGLASLVMEKEMDKGNGAFLSWLDRKAATVFLERPDKRFLKVDVSLLPVGQEGYSLFILSDVTKLKEVEILKGQIVSIVSHEMKTPMTNILGFSELLVGELDGEMNRYAAIIKDESERLTRFVNTFLDINRIEEGRQRIAKTDVDLGGLVREAAAKVQPLALSRDIRVVVAAPAGTRTVSLDRDLTLQCILNLTENAVKYSPHGTEISIAVVERPNAASIDVVDHGYGIRSAELGRIFEKFYRSDAAAEENIKGSGLGLTFVKEACEAQGGRVEVQSTFGKGSTFSIVFPV